MGTWLPVFDDETLRGPCHRLLFDVSGKKLHPLIEDTDGKFGLKEPSTFYGFYSHECDECSEPLYDPEDAPLFFVQHFDGVSGTLTFVGSIHLRLHRPLHTALQELQKLAGIAGHEGVCIWREKVGRGVVSVDVTKTPYGSFLCDGTLIIQRNSDEIKYASAFERILLDPLPVIPKFSLHSNGAHIGSLFLDKRGSDVTINYGPSSSLSMACHRVVITVAPYFDNLIYGTLFKPVTDAVTIHESQDPEAVELLVRYMYVQEARILTETSSATKLALLRLADFLLWDAPSETCLNSLEVDSVELACDVLELGMSVAPRMTQRLFDRAVCFLVRNTECFHQPGRVKDLLMENEIIGELVAERLEAEHPAVNAKLLLRSLRSRNIV